MNILQRLTRLLAALVVVYAIGLTIYLFFFARLTYQGVRITSVPGQPDVTSTFTTQEPFISAEEPIRTTFVIGFGLVLVAGALGVWRHRLALAAVMAVVALAGSYITGFSIGGLYFPVAIALMLAVLLLAFAPRTA